MTTSNLAMAIFVVTIVLFALSLFNRRPGIKNPTLQVILKILGVLIVVLTIVYFRMRLAGQ